MESDEVRQTHEHKIAFDDSTAAVLLIALKEPESDLSVLKSILNKVAYNELVSDLVHRIHSARNFSNFVLYLSICMFIAIGTRCVLCIPLQKIQNGKGSKEKG